MGNHDHDHDHEPIEGEQKPLACFEGDLETAFRLHIQDNNLAAWTPITNKFRKNVECFHWEGVLVQWGDFINSAKRTKLQDVFEKVIIKANDGSVAFDSTVENLHPQNQLVWINIVQEKLDLGEDRESPMSNLHLWKLRLRHPRLKSLHSYLEPFPGGITLWVDRSSSYTCQTTHSCERFFGFRFWVPRDENLRVRVSVSVWDDPRSGEIAPDRTPLGAEGRTDIDSVQLVLKGHGNHPGHDNPPPGT